MNFYDLPDKKLPVFPYFFIGKVGKQENFWMFFSDFICDSQEIFQPM